eukprot:1140710-Pelagomonas_calceolata.AAC.3
MLEDERKINFEPWGLQDLSLLCFATLLLMLPSTPCAMKEEWDTHCKMQSKPEVMDMQMSRDTFSVSGNFRYA